MQTLANALIAGSGGALAVFLILFMHSETGSDRKTTFRAAGLTAAVLLLASLVFSLIV
ncbi:hypothetical protein G3I40_11445 [Streptomyces sp. SID14478]|uniref:hypothetical protein n=1 Tax=Streptomyces sp. SID14478 TaxID=2706073 RepID=UPI0013DB9BA8|nr:hypothetical protein [Streptomyces sp. SID14478]NEB75836.1 hypothetical protein [Streptomyces sp. SID14478]